MKNIIVEKEDFNFNKDIYLTNSTNSTTITRIIKIKFMLYSLFALLAIGAAHTMHIKNEAYASTIHSTTLQDLHNIKEQSATLVSQLSFSYKNINTVMYNLETNPIMNLTAQKSLTEFFIKKKQTNKKFDFLTIQDSPPIHSESSFIDGKKYDTISVPSIENITDLTTNNIEKYYTLINFTYETINGKYILKSID